MNSIGQVCVVAPIKVQSHNAVSCNQIAVIKVDSRKMAKYHFEIQKWCEDIGKGNVEENVHD